MGSMEELERTIGTGNSDEGSNDDGAIHGNGEQKGPKIQKRQRKLWWIWKKEPGECTK